MKHIPLIQMVRILRQYAVAKNLPREHKKLGKHHADLFNLFTRRKIFKLMITILLSGLEQGAIILFWIFCAVVTAIAVLYLVASIEVHNEMKKAKQEEQHDLSLKNHDWKNLKNNPWEEDVRNF